MFGRVAVAVGCNVGTSFVSLGIDSVFKRWVWERLRSDSRLFPDVEWCAEVREMNAESKALLFGMARAAERTRKKREAEYVAMENDANSIASGASLASLSFISGGKPKLKVWNGARRVQVSIPDDAPRVRAEARKIGKLLGQIDDESGKRGEITGFSAASRRRLFEKLSTVRRDAEKPLFYTLTIPRELYEGVARSKEWHAALWKRMLVLYPDACALWKIEPQKDGTAHFHGLLWGVDFLPWQWLSVAWVEVMSGCDLGDGYPVIRGEVGAWAFRKWAEKVAGGAVLKGLNAATRVEAIRTWRGVMSYAAKYVGKKLEGEALEKSGRYWGVVGRKNFPGAECVEEQVEFEVAYKAIRLIRRKLRAWRGWEHWIERARTLIDDSPETFWRLKDG